MAAVTVHSDFGAQENKICYCVKKKKKGKLQDVATYAVAPSTSPAHNFPSAASDADTPLGEPQGSHYW